MPTYIILGNHTEQGIKTIKEAPQRAEQNTKRIEAAGGKVIGRYETMGQYDRVLIVEYPNDETALANLLRVGAQGNIRTTTLRAFTQAEFTKIIKTLA